MPRSYSLSKKRDFDTLFKTGKRINSKYFSIVYSPSKELKLAFIISKKVSKNAVDRNYSRRVIKEIIRKKFIPSNNQSVNIAIVCKVNLRLIEFSTIEDQLVNLLQTII